MGFSRLDALGPDLGRKKPRSERPSRFLSHRFFFPFFLFRFFWVGPGERVRLLIAIRVQLSGPPPSFFFLWKAIFVSLSLPPAFVLWDLSFSISSSRLPPMRFSAGDCEGYLRLPVPVPFFLSTNLRVLCWSFNPGRVSRFSRNARRPGRPPPFSFSLFLSYFFVQCVRDFPRKVRLSWGAYFPRLPISVCSLRLFSPGHSNL